MEELWCLSYHNRSNIVQIADLTSNLPLDVVTNSGMYPSVPPRSFFIFLFVSFFLFLIFYITFILMLILTFEYSFVSRRPVASTHGQH